MSKPEIISQLKALSDKLDTVSSKLAGSDWPAEEVDELCDDLTEAQVLASNITSAMDEHNCACTKEWKAEHTVIAERTS